jgi:ABC-type bacteriocin/lantibiotic exporter with double-glycine peptidase domain
VKLVEQVKRTLALLDPKSQKKFLSLVILQMGLGFLDLLAILIVGLFSYTGSAYLSISVLPENFKRYLNLLGFPVNDLGRTLVYLISIAVILMVGKSILSLLILKRTFHFLANRSAEISERIGMRFMHSSYSVINSVSSQEATYAVARGLHIGEILGGFTVIISEITMLFMISGFIVVVDPLLAVTILIYFISLYLLSQKKLGMWMRENSASFSDSTVKGDQAFQDGISLYKELFIANKLSFVIAHFAKLRWKVADSTANMQLVSYIPKLTFESALIIGTCLIGIQQVFVSSAENVIATLIMCLTAGSRILPSLLRLQSATSAIQSVSGGSKIAFNLIRLMDADEADKGESRSQFKPLQSTFKPSVEISDLNFSYKGQDIFTIKDLSLSVSAGSSLAIVGKTGSGKSTLVDLMLGILEPISGSVKISGVDPFSAIQTWPGSIGYVPQVVAFINGNVRENVAIGVDANDSDDSFVWDCLRMAQLDTLFKETADGLDTSIGERGIRLSGGQRQRLGIARALYSKPKLLILDEATSALDAETEKAVAETIHNLAQKVTLIVIAHRIATVQELDQVIYLDGGQIIAKGSFDEVRAMVPQFERQAKLLGL